LVAAFGTRIWVFMVHTTKKVNAVSLCVFIASTECQVYMGIETIQGSDRAYLQLYKFPRLGVVFDCR
jgi:uncharacterized membrane protein